MAAPFVVPFNFQPFSTTIKTASYTVPAGYYARITPMLNNISVDGVYINNGPLTVQSGDTTNLTLNIHAGQPYIFNWALIGSGTDYYTINGVNYGRGGTAPYNTASGSVLLVPTNFASTVSMTYTGTASEGPWSLQLWTSTPNNSQFWVKTGTVMDGSRYIVELYPQIT